MDSTCDRICAGNVEIFFFNDDGKLDLCYISKRRHSYKENNSVLITICIPFCWGLIIFKISACVCIRKQCICWFVMNWWYINRGFKIRLSWCSMNWINTNTCFSIWFRIKSWRQWSLQLKLRCNVFSWCVILRDT